MVPGIAPFAPLGAVDDPRAAYLAWAADVKRYGGVVARAPASTAQITEGATAARYPVAVIAPPPTYNLNPLFKRWPDLWTNAGDFGWYAAPDAVRAYFEAGFTTSGDPQGLQAQQAPGESPPPNPKWYDDFLTALKAGGWIIGGLVALTVLSYLPRRRES